MTELFGQSRYAKQLDPLLHEFTDNELYAELLQRSRNRELAGEQQDNFGVDLGDGRGTVPLGDDNLVVTFYVYDPDDNRTPLPVLEVNAHGDAENSLVVWARPVADGTRTFGSAELTSGGVPTASGEDGSVGGCIYVSGEEKTS